MAPTPIPVFSAVELRQVVRQDELLVVAYSERAGRIRIIQARVAEPKERRAYESDQETQG